MSCKVQDISLFSYTISSPTFSKKYFYTNHIGSLSQIFLWMSSTAPQQWSRKTCREKNIFCTNFKKTSRQISQNVLTFWAAYLLLLASADFSLQVSDLHNCSTSHISFLTVLHQQFLFYSHGITGSPI